MIRFFTTLGGFLLGSLLITLLLIFALNPSFLAKQVLSYGAKSFGVPSTNKVDKFLDQTIIDGAIDSPLALTYLGLDSLNFLTGHKSKLGDYSLEKSESDYEESLKQLNYLNRFNQNDMPDGNYNLQIKRFSLDNDIRGFESFRFHSSPVTQFFGAHLSLVEFLTDQHKVNNERDIKFYFDRINEVPRVIGEIIGFLDKRAENGIFSPEFVYKKAMGQIDTLSTGRIEDHPLYKTLEKKIDEINLSKNKKENYLDDAKNLIKEVFVPAYRRLFNTLESQSKNAREMVGVWGLPNGNDYYKHRLRIYTTTDYSADEIHNIGLKMVSEIQNEIRSILESEGYDISRPLPELYEVLNSEERFYYEDSDEGREQILADYTKIQNEAMKKMPDYFNELPKSEVIVKRVPIYSEQSAAGGYYQSPALDGSRPGVFYANLYDIKATKKFGMPALSFHEAVPGHHFQNALNIENSTQTLWKKFGYGTSAYGEGWALYAERLAIEIGLVEDPYDLIGSLQSELFRAVRLVIDTGMHSKKWTREKAIDYMIKNVGSEESEAISEVERYIVWPGQACAYMIGRIKIMELRDKAIKELGDDFDIKDFHSAVLMNGSLPLTVLESVIEDYIAESKI